jgi:hypothetical protein
LLRAYATLAHNTSVPAAHDCGVNFQSMLITEYKSKLAKHLSYPLGNEVISQKLAIAIEHREMKNISFHSTGLLNSGNGKVKKYRVMEVGYNKLDIPYCNPIESPLWSLALYSVQKQSKKIIAELLISTGLQEASDWLKRQRKDTWLMKSHGFVIYYDENTESIYFEET